MGWKASTSIDVLRIAMLLMHVQVVNLIYFVTIDILRERLKDIEYFSNLRKTYKVCWYELL